MHDRPEDAARMATLLQDLATANLFTFIPGRYFSARPSFPRDVRLWLGRLRYTKWAEEKIVEAGESRDTRCSLQITAIVTR